MHGDEVMRLFWLCKINNQYDDGKVINIQKMLITTRLQSSFIAER